MPGMVLTAGVECLLYVYCNSTCKVSDGIIYFTVWYGTRIRTLVGLQLGNG